jgi:hypothetical protein
MLVVSPEGRAIVEILDTQIARSRDLRCPWEACLGTLVRSFPPVQRSERIMGRVFGSQDAANQAQAALYTLLKNKKASDLAWYTVELNPGPQYTPK